jgi:hypothetical protein
VDEATTNELLAAAAVAERTGVQVEIRQFAAA